MFHVATHCKSYLRLISSIEVIFRNWFGVAEFFRLDITEKIEIDHLQLECDGKNIRVCGAWKHDEFIRLKSKISSIFVTHYCKYCGKQCKALKHTRRTFKWQFLTVAVSPSDCRLIVYLFPRNLFAPKETIKIKTQQIDGVKDFYRQIAIKIAYAIAKPPVTLIAETMYYHFDSIMGCTVSVQHKF